MKTDKWRNNIKIRRYRKQADGIIEKLSHYRYPDEKKAVFDELEQAVRGLDAEEVVKAKDLELETGSIFEVEKDFTGLEIPDEKKVKITFHEAKNEEKQDFTTDYEDTYKAVYYVEPVSGHPIYQINRKLIVKEAVVQVAESENQESVSNQEDENEAEGEEPAIGTAESEEPVQDEGNVEIPSEDKIYEEVTPTEIPVEEEPIQLHPIPSFL